jgi:methionine synthase I (cobalamin-dependent)
LIVLDGAFGSWLLARGADRACLEASNLTHPSLVLELARSYVRAGAEFVGTNSFQANSVALAAYGLEHQTAAINRAAARLSREAAGDGAAVIGSIGPVGVTVREPRLEPARACDAYAEQAAALAEGGADALVLETLVDLEEAELALEVLAREATVPFGVCMSFNRGANGPVTPTGATPEALAAAARRHGAAFVGANCGDGFAQSEALARALLGSGLPVWLKPSAGLPADGPFDAAARARFVELGPRLAALGVSAFGGCCGTDPELVAALRARLGPVEP